MALVSISEAAKLAGIARSQLYSQYIKRGVLSVSKDAQDKPKIDTAELLRVFGSISHQTETVGQDNRTPIQDRKDSSPDASYQQAIIALLTEQLAEAKEREKFYQQQLTELSQTIKLLEHKPTSEPRKWWQVWK